MQSNLSYIAGLSYSKKDESQTPLFTKLLLCFADQNKATNMENL